MVREWSEESFVIDNGTICDSYQLYTISTNLIGEEVSIS